MQAGLRRSPPNNRAFSYAVLASVLLHGVLLFALPGFREGKRQSAVPGPIVARLVQPSPPKAEAAVPQAEPPKPQVEPPAPPLAAPPPKPSPIARAEPKAPSKPAPVAPPQSAPAAPPAAPVAPPASATTAPGPVAKTEPQPGAQAEFGTLNEYERAIRIAAAKYKRYPRVAMDNNWEGTAEVTMVIGANGIISSVSIKTSTGHEILDQQAIDMFRKAKPLVPIPSALRGKEFTVVLRAIYSLKEPDG